MDGKIQQEQGQTKLSPELTRIKELDVVPWWSPKMEKNTLQVCVYAC